VGLSRVLLGAISAITCAAASAGTQAPAGGGPGPVLVLQGRTELPGYSGDFDHFAVDLPGGRLFLAAEDHGTLEVFELQSGKHLQSVRGFETPHSIFPIPQTHKLLITDGSDSIKLLDDRTLAPAGTIKLHPGADSIGFDGTTGHLYVVTGGKDVKLKESWLEEIDPVSTRKVGEVHLDADHVEAMAVEQHGGRQEHAQNRRPVANPRGPAERPGATRRGGPQAFHRGAESRQAHRPQRGHGCQHRQLRSAGSRRCRNLR
jgi:hypothetical protein